MWIVREDTNHGDELYKIALLPIPDYFILYNGMKTPCNPTVIKKYYIVYQSIFPGSHQTIIPAKMKKIFSIYCLLLITVFFAPGKTTAQSFIAFSRLDSITERNTGISTMVMDQGETYALSDIYNESGTAYIASRIVKHGRDGSIQYIRDVGPDTTFRYWTMKAINGELFLFGNNAAAVYSYGLTAFKVSIVKLHTDGSIAFTKLISSSAALSILGTDVQVINNEIIMTGFAAGIDFPVTIPGPVPQPASNDWPGNAFIAALNPSTGEITRSRYLGYIPMDQPREENGALYYVSRRWNTFLSLPVTIGSVPPPGSPTSSSYGYTYVEKINLNDFSTVYSRYVSEHALTGVSDYIVKNGEVHLIGVTTSPDLYVTNGTILYNGTSAQDGFYTRLHADGTIAVSTYLSEPGFRFYPRNIKATNGNVYISGEGQDIANLSSLDLVIYKLNPDASTAYLKRFDYAPYPAYISSKLEVVNDELYVMGTGISDAFPVTNGSHYVGNSASYGHSAIYFAHLNTSGNIVFAGLYGSALYGYISEKFYNNIFYIVTTTEFPELPTTDSSIGRPGREGLVLALRTDGSVFNSSYIGGNNDDIIYTSDMYNGDIYIYGYTDSDDFPLTNSNDSIHAAAGFDDFVTKISFCPANYKVSGDTLSPKIQTACKRGIAGIITGEEIILPGDSLPPVYRNGVLSLQQAFGGATYQWQRADALTGPWSDIPNAALKDYAPAIGDIDQYFRRKCFMPANCGAAFIHFSDTAVVFVNTFTSPTLNAGGNFNTCPSSPITIGATPVVSGGNPPYTYSWNMGLLPVENPTVSPLNNTIYTLTVTDASGCRQMDQAVVLVHKANAGADKSSCAGAPVKIGASPISGIPGVTYLWQPASNLTSTSIAQPFANPPVQTQYDLTLTIPKTNGGSCTTYDTMKVTPVAAPVNTNFAGPDKIICTKSNATFGSSPEPGFTYTWSQSPYLSNINNSVATYSYPWVPQLNPLTVRLSAYKNGCTFTDEATLTVLNADAGPRDCGPRYVGTPDQTPNINETYSWIKVYGPGNFLGPVNLPMVPVSASIGDSTVYLLTVSYSGTNCTSQVVVPEECNSACNIEISVIAPHICPGYAANNGNVKLRAVGGLSDGIYTWLPQEGLSTYTGNIVSLTDNIPRTYTLTVTSALDTSIHCSDTIAVNDPSFIVPVFPVRDTVTCYNVPVMIGLPPVAGDSYLWGGGTGLSDIHISNPVATTVSSTAYFVVVGNIPGCYLFDTVIVAVQNIPADAGFDLFTCSNGLVELGTAAQPNTTYLWEPQLSPWQNGTNEFSAQPQVLISTTATYSLTTTTSAGCISTDEVIVTVNDSPTITDSPDLLICPGQGVNIGDAPLPGVSYQWTPITGLSDPTSALTFASPGETTTYTLLAIFPGTCSAPVTDQVTITVDDPSFHIPDIHFCPSDGAIDLGANVPAGLSNFYWTPDNLVIGQYTANATTADPQPNITTVFTLSASNAAGCYYTDTFSIIPVIATPLAGADKTICKDQSITIGSAANVTDPTISYSWNPVNDLSDPSSPNPVFTGTTAGTFSYILTKTDNSIPCSINDTINITVADILPQLNSPTICRNSCVQIGSHPVNGILYQWSPVNGLSDPSIANPVACIDTVTTTYTLTLNNQAGCITSATVVVGVNEVPGLQASVPDIIACIGDNNIMFNPSLPAGSYTYLWSPDNGTLSDINIANPVIEINDPGNYQYNLQLTDDATGCTNTLTSNITMNICSPYADAGNFMWFDTNENGIQDGAELGVSGVAVKLYNNIGFNVATTVTDAYGAYSFDAVPPGNDYYIIFQKPAGYEFTIPNVGGIAATDNSKADAGGRTGNFNLIAGEVISNMDAGIKPAQIVPVTLLSFTATLKNRQVLLNWQTTAEINNAYFDVERSNDGISFTTIGRVAGNGTTSLPHNYSLIDPHPLAGLNYYRLRQVDFDGHFKYSNVEVVLIKDNETIIAWYNDHSNNIQILFNKPQNNPVIKLYASNGQLIRSEKVAGNINSYNMSLPVLSTGIYMLQAVSDKLQYSKKIFIRR